MKFFEEFHVIPGVNRLYNIQKRNKKTLLVQEKNVEDFKKVSNNVKITRLKFERGWIVWIIST